MDRMERREQQIAHAKIMFSHHKAVFRQLDGISTLDWRNENGSSEYYVRYVFDEERCCLYLSGDLGSAVVRLTEHSTLKTLSRYIKMIDYFVGKIECSTDKYRYDEEIAKEELKEILFPEDVMLSDEEKEERQDCFEELMEQFNNFHGFGTVSQDSDRVLSEAYADYWEWIAGAGQYIAPRIILWLVGLQMAWEQVKNEVAADD